MNSPLQNLLKALKAREKDLSVLSIGFPDAVSNAYTAYKAAPPPRVLEQCPRSKTVLFLNQEIPVVVFEGISYRLPDGENR